MDKVHDLLELGCAVHLLHFFVAEQDILKNDVDGVSVRLQVIQLEHVLVGPQMRRSVSGDHAKQLHVGQSSVPTSDGFFEAVATVRAHFLVSGGGILVTQAKKKLAEVLEAE